MSDDQARRRAASDLNLQGRISTDYQTRQHQATQDLLVGGKGDHQERYNAFIHGGTTNDSTADTGASGGGGIGILLLAGIVIVGGLLWFIWQLLTDPFFANDVMTSPFVVIPVLLGFLAGSVVLPATAILVLAALILISSGGNFLPEWLPWTFRDLEHFPSVLIMLAVTALIGVGMFRVEMPGLQTRPIAFARIAWRGFVLSLVAAAVAMFASSDATTWPQSTVPAAFLTVAVVTLAGVAFAVWRLRGRTFEAVRPVPAVLVSGIVATGMIMSTLAAISFAHNNGYDVGSAPYGREAIKACMGDFASECTNAEVMFANLQHGYLYDGDTLPRWFAERTYIKDVDPALWDNLTTGVKKLSVRAEAADTPALREAIVRDYAHLATRLNELMDKTTPSSSFLYHPLRATGSRFNQ
jgi:hypothetical protein